MRTVKIDDHGNLIRVDVKDLDVSRDRKLTNEPEKVMSKINETKIKGKEQGKMGNFENMVEHAASEVHGNSEGSNLGLDHVATASELPAALEVAPVADQENCAAKIEVQEPEASPVVTENVEAAEVVQGEQKSEVKTLSFDKSSGDSAHLVSIAGPYAKRGVIALNRSGNKPVTLGDGVTVLNVRAYRDQYLVVFAVNGSAAALQLSSVSERVRDVTSQMSIMNGYVYFREDAVALCSTLEKYL